MTAPYASELTRLYAEIERLAVAADVQEVCPRPENRQQEDRCWIVEGPQHRFTEYYMERGQASVVVEGSYDEVLFHVMRSAAQDKATRIERRQRINGEDTRRQWYAIQREIMARMKAEWSQTLADHQAKVLAQHPFRDDNDLA